MPMSQTRPTAVYAAVAAGVVSLGIATSAIAADAIDHLPGRWSGWGSITLSNGSTEQLKCVATYFVENAGASLKQNLRCASASYKIDAVTNMTVSGNSVSGNWEERTHSNSGEVSGRIAGKNVKLNITGQNFNAGLALKTSPCKLSINFTPQGLDITRIAIGLRKC